MTSTVRKSSSRRTELSVKTAHWHGATTDSWEKWWNNSYLWTKSNNNTFKPSVWRRPGRLRPCLTYSRIERIPPPPFLSLCLTSQQSGELWITKCQAPVGLSSHLLKRFPLFFFLSLPCDCSQFRQQDQTDTVAIHRAWKTNVGLELHRHTVTGLFAGPAGLWLCDHSVLASCVY